jgi:selenide,water dikinase
MTGAAPAERDIVLVGGGHAHVQVLTALAARPIPRTRVTLIARDRVTLYSGMLPGTIAGLYRPEQASIDLKRLAAATGARFVHAEATGLDRARKQVLLADGSPIAYGMVSFDVGIAPSLTTIVGADKHAIAVKPIGHFLAKFDDLLARSVLPGGPRRIAMIGGGAGGVELVLSIRARLIAAAPVTGGDRPRFAFTLITAGEILETHNRRVRSAFRRILSQRGIAVLEHRSVHSLSSNTVEFDGGAPLGVDATLLATDAAAPQWFAHTGLSLDPGGFLAVGPTLQVLNDPDVFAAGDCAAMVDTPRAKAGVYAVRAGPPLAQSLRRRAAGQPLRPWTPQSRHLALISTGERYAVASWGPWKAEGAWLWQVKDWIDRRWVGTYQC